mgnify:CR=1 FL=1
MNQLKNELNSKSNQHDVFGAELFGEAVTDEAQWQKDIDKEQIGKNHVSGSLILCFFRAGTFPDARGVWFP